VRIVEITPEGARDVGHELSPILDRLHTARDRLARIPVRALLVFLDDFGKRLLRDPRTNRLPGVMFLANWLRRANQERLLELNVNGDLDYLDGFVEYGRDYLAAKPHGLVAAWMAGNIPTLPVFTLAPALLGKNVSLIKLADSQPESTAPLLEVLAESRAENLTGREVLDAFSVIWFDYRERDLNEAMSLAADAKIIWGGAEAVAAISGLARQEHCVEIVFGPKYSIGIVDRGRLENPDGLENVISAFVRDVAIFDQRACSSPHTLFVERNDRLDLQEIGELFAAQFLKLPPKPELDAYTAIQIQNTRAEWALAEERDVIASALGADWTVCLDRELRLKDAVQSRTIFVTEIGSWREVIPLLSPKVQTAGVAFDSRPIALAFAEAATGAGVARCVRPGLMHLYESPWDGKLLTGQLVRWVTLKP
jgi:hypothetical protein